MQILIFIISSKKNIRYKNWKYSKKKENDLLQNHLPSCCALIRLNQNIPIQRYIQIFVSFNRKIPKTPRNPLVKF